MPQCTKKQLEAGLTRLAQSAIAINCESVTGQHVEPSAMLMRSAFRFRDPNSHEGQERLWPRIVEAGLLSPSCSQTTTEKSEASTNLPNSPRAN